MPLVLLLLIGCRIAPISIHDDGDGPGNFAHLDYVDHEMVIPLERR